MKAILMSIKPQYVAKILNEIKTLEIRKRFPSDYVGWVYIYCTKDQNEELWWYDGTEDFRLYKKGIANEKYIGWHLQNGKVIARFWCDKVEEIEWNICGSYYGIDFKTQTLTHHQLLDASCLDFYALNRYLECENPHINPKGYAIHITKLEIFDKPKELNMFGTLTNKCNGFRGGLKPLTRAPQSYCFIEI